MDKTSKIIFEAILNATSLKAGSKEVKSILEDLEKSFNNSSKTTNASAGAQKIFNKTIYDTSETIKNYNKNLYDNSVKIKENNKTVYDNSSSFKDNSKVITNNKSSFHDHSKTINTDTTSIKGNISSLHSQSTTINNVTNNIIKSTNAINDKTLAFNNLINSSQILNRVFSGILYQSIYKIQQIISQATDDIKKFESTIYEIKQIEGNNVGSFGVIAKDSLKLATDLKESSTVIAEAMRIGLASGMEYGDELETIVKESARFSRATNTDIKEVMNMAILLKNNFKIASKDIGTALNQVGVSARESKLDLKDYVAQIGGIASSTMLSNVPLREQLALFSLFGNKLRNASESAVAVKNLFAKIENPTKNMEKWATLASSKGINIQFGAQNLKDAKTMENFLSNFAKGLEQIKNNKDILADMFGDQRAKKGLVQAFASSLPNEEITKKYPEIAKALGKSLISEFDKIKYEILNDTEYINKAYSTSFKSLESRSKVAINTIQNEFKLFFINHEKDIHNAINNFESLFNNIFPYLKELKPLIKDVFSQFAWINENDGLKIALKTIAWFVSSAIGILSSWANAVGGIISFVDGLLNGFVQALIKMTEIVSKYGKALLNPFSNKARNEALRDLDIALSDQSDLIKKHYDNMIKQVEKLGKKVLDSGKAFSKIDSNSNSIKVLDTRTTPKSSTKQNSNNKKDFSSPELFGDGTIDLIGNPRLDEAKSIIEQLQNNNSDSIAKLKKEAQKLQKNYELDIGFLKQSLENKKITQKEYDESLKIYTEAFNLQMLELAKKQSEALNKIDEIRAKKINDQVQKSIDEQNKAFKEKYDKEDYLLQKSLETTDKANKKRQSNIEKLAIIEHQSESKILNNQIWADKEKIKSLKSQLKKETLSYKEREKLELELEETKNKIDINNVKRNDLLLEKQWQKNKSIGESELALYNSKQNDKLQLGQKFVDYEKALEEDILNDKNTSLDFIIDLRKKDLDNAKNTYGETSAEYIKANREVEDLKEKQVQNINNIYSSLIQNTGLLSEQGTNFLNTLSKDFDLSTGKMIDNAQGLSGALKALQEGGFNGLVEFAKNGGNLSGILTIFQMITDSAVKLGNTFKSVFKEGVNNVESFNDILSDILDAVTLGIGKKIASSLGADTRNFGEKAQALKELTFELNQEKLKNEAQTSDKLIQIATNEYNHRVELINNEIISIQEKQDKIQILTLEHEKNILKIRNDNNLETLRLNNDLFKSRLSLYESYADKVLIIEADYELKKAEIRKKVSEKELSVTDGHKQLQIIVNEERKAIHQAGFEEEEKNIRNQETFLRSKLALNEESKENNLAIARSEYDEYVKILESKLKFGLISIEDYNNEIFIKNNELAKKNKDIQEKYNKDIQALNQKNYDVIKDLKTKQSQKEIDSLKSQIDKEIDLIKNKNKRLQDLEDERNQVQSDKDKRRIAFSQALLSNPKNADFYRANPKDFENGLKGISSRKSELEDMFSVGEISQQRFNDLMAGIGIEQYQFYMDKMNYAIEPEQAEEFRQKAMDGQKLFFQYIFDAQKEKIENETKNAEKQLEIDKKNLKVLETEQEKVIANLDSKFKDSSGEMRNNYVSDFRNFITDISPDIEKLGTDLYNTLKSAKEKFSETDKEAQKLGISSPTGTPKTPMSSPAYGISTTPKQGETWDDMIARYKKEDAQVSKNIDITNNNINANPYSNPAPKLHDGQIIADGVKRNKIFNDMVQNSPSYSKEYYIQKYGSMTTKELEDLARLRGIPGYKTGIDNVPNTQFALLHKGEAVLNEYQAEIHRKGLNRTNNNYQNSTTVVNVNLQQNFTANTTQDLKKEMTSYTDNVLLPRLRSYIR